MAGGRRGLVPFVSSTLLIFDRANKTNIRPCCVSDGNLERTMVRKFWRNVLVTLCVLGRSPCAVSSL